ncbi:dynamin family protein [Colletotrichum sojae]|uniref:Dynamin family protein n=1 Tax=Colletotrichum sojae TaxID=2175907 RepID=A0A8H6IPP1_9PEZI|nr:dynamin family protein [Colletotrichum sojae]
MGNPCNMILVISDGVHVDQREDFVSLAHECDPHGHRSFGLLFTQKKLKDAQLGEASISHLGLGCRFGWHAIQDPLVPLGSDGKPKPPREVCVWSPGELDHKQDVPLKDRLSRAFGDHTEQQLPGIVVDIENVLQDRRDEMKGTDSPHFSVETHRQLLLDFSMKFTSLITAAVGGANTYPLFISTEKHAPRSHSSRLRGVVNELLAKVEKAPRDSSSNQSRRLELKENKSPAGLPTPKANFQADHEAESLDDQLWEHQRHELPGTMSFTIASAVGATTSNIVASAADPQIKPIVSHIMRLALDILVHDLSNKTRQLLAPYYSMHPIACSQHITEAVRKAQHDRTRKHVRRLFDSIGLKKSGDTLFIHSEPKLLLDTMASHVEEELQQQPVAAAIDFAKAYCQSIMNLSDDEIRNLASDPGVTTERRNLEEQCDFLEKCLEELRSYLPAQPSDDHAASETDEYELRISPFGIYTPEDSIDDTPKRPQTPINFGALFSITD